MKDLEQQFYVELNDTISELRKLDIDTSRLQQKLALHGGVGTAKILLESKDINDVLFYLLEKDKVELSAEYLALKEEYAVFFTEEELDVARRRLGI